MSVPTRNFFRSCFGYLCCVTIPSSVVEDTLAQETPSTPPAVHDYSSKPPVQETDSHLSSTQQSQAPPAQDPEASDLRPDGDTSHETPLDVPQPSLAPAVPNYSSTPPVQETDSQSQAPSAQDLEGSDTQMRTHGLQRMEGL
ncbi:hypothetical protein F5887DRAFT_1076817 [Amanita rubescens]|nr:hypothetical protein F5887DRAFT_1076817 [Amanita rubescens]